MVMANGTTACGAVVRAHLMIAGLESKVRPLCWYLWVRTLHKKKYIYKNNNDEEIRIAYFWCRNRVLGIQVDNRTCWNTHKHTCTRTHKSWHTCINKEWEKKNHIPTGAQLFDHFLYYFAIWDPGGLPVLQIGGLPPRGRDGVLSVTVPRLRTLQVTCRSMQRCRN